MLNSLKCAQTSLSLSFVDLDSSLVGIHGNNNILKICLAQNDENNSVVFVSISKINRLACAGETKMEKWDYLKIKLN